MNHKTLVALLGTATLGLAACSPASNEAPEPVADAPVTLHAVMKEQIDANADALWDVTNTAIGVDASLDPALLDDAKWTQIADLAAAVEAGAHTLANMDPIPVALPGAKLSDQDIQDGHSPEQVQAFVDAHPDDFRSLANALELHVGQIAAAARNKDAATAGPLINQLDGVCEDCHLEFWYPEQRELVEQFRHETGAAPAR